MPRPDFPPHTRDELNDFFTDLVRASVQDLLKGAAPGNGQPVPGAGAQAQQPAPDHQPDNISAKIRQAQPDDSCNCQSCEAGRSTDRLLQPDPEDIQWFNSRVKHALAVSLAVRRRHSTWVYLTPQGRMDWYSQLFSAIIGISVLGAGFTFSVIFNDFELPTDREDYSSEYVRKCLAASWMLFVVSIGFTSFVALVISVNKSRFLDRLEKVCYKGEKFYSSSFLIGVVFSTLLVQLLPIGAFLASAEAVRAYHNPVGIATWVLLSGTGVAIVLFWLAQNSQAVRDIFLDDNDEADAVYI